MASNFIELWGLRTRLHCIFWKKIFNFGLFQKWVCIYTYIDFNSFFFGHSCELSVPWHSQQTLSNLRSWWILPHFTACMLTALQKQTQTCEPFTLLWVFDNPNSWSPSIANSKFSSMWIHDINSFFTKLLALVTKVTSPRAMSCTDFCYIFVWRHINIHRTTIYYAVRNNDVIWKGVTWYSLIKHRVILLPPTEITLTLSKTLKWKNRLVLSQDSVQKCVTWCKIFASRPGISRSELNSFLCCHNVLAA